MVFTPRQIIALFGGFVVMLVQGSLYVYGTMTPYLFTYLYYQGTLPPTQARPTSASASSRSSTPSPSS
jgi:Sec-independent protein secretion pathway component TatC